MSSPFMMTVPFLVMADRAYNNSLVETFHIPARKAGVELVIDYRTGDLGLQGHYEDLILVDGNWHVRSLPEKLINATKELAELVAAKSALSGPITGTNTPRSLHA